MKKVLCLILSLLCFLPLAFAEDYGYITSDYDYTDIDYDYLDIESNNSINTDLLSVSSNALVNTNEENSYKIIIDDTANLLTDEERSDLMTQLYGISKYGNVAFVTTYNNTVSDSYSYKGTLLRNWSDQYFDNTFGNGVSGVILYVDMTNRYFYIFSDGLIYETITDNVADVISDNCYKEIKNEKYYQFAYKAFYQINQKLEGDTVLSPVRYISTALLSLLVSFLIIFIYIDSTCKVKPKKGSYVTKYAQCNFTGVYKGAHFTHQTKVYNPPDSGGSSGGGGGGGGGSSGGGGGHGF